MTAGGDLIFQLCGFLRQLVHLFVGDLDPAHEGVVPAVRPLTMQRRQATVEAHLGIRQRLGDGEPQCAQAGCAQRNQQGLDRLLPTVEVANALRNEVCPADSRAAGSRRVDA